MRFLLDTHAFMWWDSAPDRIPAETLKLLQDPTNEVLLSLVSLWEMQIKLQLGKLTLNNDLEVIVQAQQNQNHLDFISVTLPHIFELGNLPPIHKDPFDRLLIAQAKVENATLVSRDTVFKNYDCSIIW